MEKFQGSESKLNVSSLTSLLEEILFGLLIVLLEAVSSPSKLKSRMDYGNARVGLCLVDRKGNENEIKKQLFVLVCATCSHQ